jgi:hypothetical protein
MRGTVPDGDTTRGIDFGGACGEAAGCPATRGTAPDPVARPAMRGTLATGAAGTRGASSGGFGGGRTGGGGAIFWLGQSWGNSRTCFHAL